MSSDEDNKQEKIKNVKVPMGTKRKAKAFHGGKYTPRVPKFIAEQAHKALEALKSYSPKEEAKSDLFGNDDQEIQLHFQLKKIPYYSAARLVRVNMLKSYRSPSTCRICIIVPDESKADRFISDVDKNSSKVLEFLKFEKGVDNIHLVLSLRQLEREYCTGEAMQKLCSAYDVFIVDNRIIRQTNARLHYCFRNENKTPFPLELRHGNVAGRIEKCLAASQFCLYPYNPKSHLQFGVVSQSVEDLECNLLHAVQTLMVKLPAGMDNIRAMHIKYAHLPPIHIYLNLDSGNIVQLPPPKGIDIVEDTLDNLPKNTRVQVDMNKLEIQLVDGKRKVLNKRDEINVLKKLVESDTFVRRKRRFDKEEVEIDVKEEISDDDEMETKPKITKKKRKNRRNRRVSEDIKEEND